MQNQPHPFGSEPSHVATKIGVKIVTQIVLIHLIRFWGENKLVCNRLGETPRALQDKNDGLRLQPTLPNAKTSRV